MNSVTRRLAKLLTDSVISPGENKNGASAHLYEDTKFLDAIWTAYKEIELAECEAMDKWVKAVEQRGLKKRA